MGQLLASANSVGPDQTAPKEQSDQELHCLLFPKQILTHHGRAKANYSNLGYL